MKQRLILFSLCLSLLLFSQEFKWQETLAVSGNGTLQTCLLPLHGSEWKIAYESQEHKPLEVGLYDADGKLLQQLVQVSNANKKASLSGSKSGRLGYDGWAYLRISGSGNGWKVVFSQYISDISGWKLKRDLDRKIQMAKLGVWSGDDGDEMEIPLTITVPCWRLSANSTQGGRLKVTVCRKDGSGAQTFFKLTPGASETWFYQAGEFIIKANGLNTKWLLKVDYAKKEQ